ncbi:hypothetical protein IPdc08_00200 [archaeon]|nr:hypothetical protein IPdc08_00200 [archaeon]
MENIKEAVEVHYEDLLEKGEDIKILSISETEVHPDHLPGDETQATAANMKLQK